MTVINTAKTVNKTATNSNKKTTIVITPKMPIKPSKKVKKADFDILKFLVETHGKSLIYKVDVPETTTWNHLIKRGNFFASSAMLFLVDKYNVILYIGQTNNIYYYVDQTARNNPAMEVATVYVVCNQNASMYIHAVTAYRAKFKPLFNSTRNTRYVFHPVSALLNVTNTNVSASGWIKDNPNATYTMFITKFSIGEMRRLCRLYSIGKYSYTALKAKVLSNK